MTSKSIKRAAKRDPGKEASFVFEGTVQKAKGSTVESVPAAAGTLVVRVDRVLQSPPALRGYEGQSVTVKYWNRRRSAPRYKTTDVPFGA